MSFRYDFDASGFGSIFDGMDDGGVFGNISTQAVYDLIKHSNVEVGSGDPETVEIGHDEIQEHHVPRSEANCHNQLIGKLCCC